MKSINTIGAMIEAGYRLTAYCNEARCMHSAELDLEALAERLGRDFVAVGDPNPLVRRLRCQECGGRNLGLILSAPNGYSARG